MDPDSTQVPARALKYYYTLVEAYHMTIDSFINTQLKYPFNSSSIKYTYYSFGIAFQNSSSLTTNCLLPTFFIFRLIPSVVTTADFPSPFYSIICILLHNFSHCHVLSLLPHPAAPSSKSFSQYTHHRSSVHDHTTSVSPLVFSLQTVPPVLSLWCTHSWFCPFLSLLINIVTSSTLPPPSPPPVFSSVPPSPTRTTLLVSLPPCTPSLSL